MSIDSMEINELKSYLDSVANATNKKKVYFAGPWFDERSDAFYECARSIVQKYRDMYEVFYPKYVQHDSPKETFDSDVRNVLNCDMMLALIERKDVGTAWEIGMAHVLNKEIYLVVLDETCKQSKTNLMLAMTGKCITIEHLDALMSGTIRAEDFVNFGESWEAIE